MTMTRSTRSWSGPLLTSALIAGALDITYAIVFSYFRAGVKIAFGARRAFG